MLLLLLSLWERHAMCALINEVSSSFLHDSFFHVLSVSAKICLAVSAGVSRSNPQTNTLSALMLLFFNKTVVSKKHAPNLLPNWLSKIRRRYIIFPRPLTTFQFHLQSSALQSLAMQILNRHLCRLLMIKAHKS